MDFTEQSMLKSAIKTDIGVYQRDSEPEEAQGEGKLGERYQILGLPEQQLQLVAAGEILTCGQAIFAKQYLLGEEISDGPYLLYSKDRLCDVDDEMPFYVDDDLASCAPKLMEGLVTGMYLANHSQQTLTAKSNRNIAELLRQYSSDGIASGKARKIKLPGSAYDFLADTPNFSGRCGICSCGVPGCWSDFCWKENGQVMLHYGYVGGWIIEATLFPEFVRGPERQYGEPFR